MQSTQPLAPNGINRFPSLQQIAKPIKCRHWPTSRVRGVITFTTHDPPFVACGSLRVQTAFEMITFTAYNPPFVPRPAYASRSWLHDVGSPNKTPSTLHNHALTRAGVVIPPWFANASATQKNGWGLRRCSRPQLPWFGLGRACTAPPIVPGEQRLANQERGA
jgi:hypothetical protein